MRFTIIAMAALTLLAWSACRSHDLRNEGAAPRKSSKTLRATPPECPRAAPRLRVVEPERDLDRVGKHAKNLKRTAKRICKALRSFDFASATRELTAGARVERLYPERGAARARGGDGAESVRFSKPRRSGCFFGPGELVRTLRRIAGEWRRFDRCFFKPYRLFSTRRAPRRAIARLHLWLAGVSTSGRRVVDKGNVRVEAVERRPGHWKLSRIEWDERTRFSTARKAFSDWTLASGLPATWSDRGYGKGMYLSQDLYGGIAVGDYDGDGWPDLYVLRAGPNLLLRNDGRGGFVDATARAGVGDPGNGQAALFVDLDNDGDLDLFVVNGFYPRVKFRQVRRGHRLFRNNGNGTFTEMPNRFGSPLAATGVAAADYDGDGLVDLYVAHYQDRERSWNHHYIEARSGVRNRLFKNLGNLRFREVARRAGVASNGWSYAAAWADFDEDGRIDLYVANDFGDNNLYRNRGEGTFEDVAASRGAVDSANGMSATWADYDNDGHLDLYVSNMYSKTGRMFLPLFPGMGDKLRRKFLFSTEGNSLYRNLGGGRFQEVGRRLHASTAGWAWGANFLDYDNDGWLDIHVANGFYAGESKDDL